MEIPFLDLHAHHAPNLTEFDTVMREVISESAFTGGRFVQEFESEFSKFCHSSEAIGVGSGTEAIWLALLACGVGQGDEVITVPNTFIATCARTPLNR